MADQKVSALDTIPAVDRAADLLYIVDTSGSTPNKVTPNTLLGITGDPVGTSDTQTLINKTLTSPTISSPTLSGTLTGTYTIGGTPTFPSSVVTLTGTQTLTNKTLTSPTINTPTITNPTLTVDTISEFTSANGVNIDGLLIKDGLLPAGNIQPLNLVSGTGSSWAWQSWTPTLTNLSGGTLNYAKYIQIGKTVFFRFKYTLAGAGVAGAVSITLPVTAISQNGTDGDSTEPLADVNYRDMGTATYGGGGTLLVSQTTLNLFVWSASGSYTARANLSSTVPFNWASGDIIMATGVYEAA